MVIRHIYSPRHATKHKLFKFISPAEIRKVEADSFFLMFTRTQRNERTIIWRENGEMRFFFFRCVFFDVYFAGEKENVKKEKKENECHFSCGGISPFGMVI